MGGDAPNDLRVVLCCIITPPYIREVTIIAVWSEKMSSCAPGSSPDVQRVGGGYAAPPPTLEEQYATAKQRVLELWAQLEQRTRQLTAMHSKLTELVQAHQECITLNDDLAKRLAAESDARERLALQVAHLQQELTSERAREQEQASVSDEEKALHTELAHEAALLRQTLQQSAGELSALREAADELPSLRAAAAEAPALHEELAGAKAREQGARRAALWAEERAEQLARELEAQRVREGLLEAVLEEARDASRHDRVRAQQSAQQLAAQGARADEMVAQAEAAAAAHGDAGAQLHKAKAALRALCVTVQDERGLRRKAEAAAAAAEERVAELLEGEAPAAAQRAQTTAALETLRIAAAAQTQRFLADVDGQRTLLESERGARQQESAAHGAQLANLQDELRRTRLALAAAKQAVHNTAEAAATAIRAEAERAYAAQVELAEEQSLQAVGEKCSRLASPVVPGAISASPGGGGSFGAAPHAHAHAHAYAHVHAHAHAPSGGGGVPAQLLPEAMMMAQLTPPALQLMRTLYHRRAKGRRLGYS